MPQPIFTIGHSTRTLVQFVDLLRESRVGLVADVRSIPRSRTNPQFNRDALPTSLKIYQIGYRHFPSLGGRRNKQMPEDESPNDYWRVKSFRRYADYALCPDFLEGLAALQSLRQHRIAIMCAEAVWWRCHRRIIADYLLARGEAVFHILGPNHVSKAALTPGAQILSEGERIEYPADAVRKKPHPGGQGPFTQLAGEGR